MLESLFFVSKVSTTTISRTKKPSPMGKALHIISVTRLLTHVSLYKGAQRPKPPLQKGGLGDR